jgi:hypothetical protein
MTAKAKALQVLLAVSISAVAYTIYSHSSDKKPALVQVQSAMMIKSNNAKAKQTKPAVENTATYNVDAVPGYCDPEVSSR